MTVPLLDLRPQYAAIKDEIDEAIRRVVDSQAFVLGPEVETLERRLAEYCQVRHVVGCASGSDAILLALMALGIKPGDEVICPAYTFFATAGSIGRLHAMPVFVDIDHVTYNIDPKLVRAVGKRCRRLKAIMPVHLFGLCADMDALVELGQELSVPVIEDAAQAVGSVDARGRPAGSRGAIGCFSFYPTKNLGGFGDAGMVTTDDDQLAERLRTLRVHGEKSKYHHDLLGINSRLDAIQAAVLAVKLRHLEQWTEGRQENAARYDRVFSEAGAATGEIPFGQGKLPLRTPQPARGLGTHIYNQYVIRVPAAVRDIWPYISASRGRTSITY